MILKNIKTKDHGFTIVELLVVIVVIGILAAITIVSYTGITARANTASNKQNASSVLASAQSYYVDNSSAFPSTLTVDAFNTNNTAKLPSGLVLTAATLTSANATSIQYLKKGATGICVAWWDYSTSLVTTTPLFGGDATTYSNAATPSCT